MSILPCNSASVISAYEKFVTRGNQYIRRYSRFKLVLKTVVCTLLACKLLKMYRNLDFRNFNLKSELFNRAVPIILYFSSKEKLKAEKRMRAIERDIEEDIFKNRQYKQIYEQLPDQGIPQDKLLAELRSRRVEGLGDPTKGKSSGCLYHDDKELKEIQQKTIEEVLLDNGMQARAYPRINQMKAELIRMSSNLFHGANTDQVGCVTSGGTESITLACLTYRNLALNKGITKPEIIVPVTAHAAFSKACQLTGVKLLTIPVDPETFAVNPETLERYITRNTCGIGASFPGFPHGVADPIEQIAKIAKEKRIPFHVDGCLGSFLLPFLEEAGFGVPPFDFRVEGVTSISADFHKYGFSTKGASVLLYRHLLHYKAQLLPVKKWPGGPYVTETLAGSHPGAPIATAWTTMLSLGREGLLAATKQIMAPVKIVIQKLQKYESEQDPLRKVKLMGNPLTTVIAIASKDEKELNTYKVYTQMSRKGWHLNGLVDPPGFHFCMTKVHGKLFAEGRDIPEEFIRDLRSSIQYVLDHPDEGLSGMAQIYNSSAAIPEAFMVEAMQSYAAINLQIRPKRDQEE